MAAAVEVWEVSKRYRIGRGHPTLRGLLKDLGRPQANRYHWAVKDVSFELQPGEALGIIGPNGAGKTTILKLLSSVTRPTSGEIRVNGRLSALIELGAGFHPDLTGRENVYLNGTILGLRRRDIQRRFDGIVEFAGIGEYLDTPVKRYSSGMYARLGFSIAAHVDPEILLVDEVLSVGDMAFQAKCHQRMAELLAGGTALIFVSHNLQAVRQVCSRTLVLYRGQLAFQGPSDRAVAEYSDILRRAPQDGLPTATSEDALGERLMSQRARIEQVQLLDDRGNPIQVVAAGARLRLVVTVHFLEDAPAPVFAFTVRKPEGTIVYDTTTRWQGRDTPDFSAGERAVVEYTWYAHLVDGNYFVGTDLAYSNLSQYYDRIEHAVSFVVSGAGGAQGIADLGAQVSFARPGGRTMPNGDQSNV